jgi:PhnB protein
MQLIAYLNFDGTCREAMQAYETIFRGKIVAMMNHDEVPAGTPMPQGWGERIMHARLLVGGAVLMASDAPPDGYRPPQGIEVAIAIDEPAEADRVFAALAEGGTIKMPIQETFWAHRFGMLTDRWGIPWLVNCEKPMG